MDSSPEGTRLSPSAQSIRLLSKVIELTSTQGITPPGSWLWECSFPHYYAQWLFWRLDPTAPPSIAACLPDGCSDSRNKRISPLAQIFYYLCCYGRQMDHPSNSPSSTSILSINSLSHVYIPRSIFTFSIVSLSHLSSSIYSYFLYYIYCKLIFPQSILFSQIFSYHIPPSNLIIFIISSSHLYIPTSIFYIFSLIFPYFCYSSLHSLFLYCICSSRFSGSSTPSLSLFTLPFNSHFIFFIT